MTPAARRAACELKLSGVRPTSDFDRRSGPGGRWWPGPLSAGRGSRREFQFGGRVSDGLSG